jgi:large subunit ribosomal protein L13
LAECLAEQNVKLHLRSVFKKRKRNKMKSRSYSTKTLNESEIKREWFIVDAEGKTLGRMTSKIASVLRGKNKPTFTPNMDCGDYVIVINSAKVKMTGNKMNDRKIVHYTGFPGGQREQTPAEIVAKNPNKLIEHAIKGMLPKSSLGDKLFRKLFVYEGAEHPHGAQKPKELA